MTSRITHRLTDGLPESAQQVLLDGVEARLTAGAISAKLAALGFPVPPRSVARRAREYWDEVCRSHAVEELSRLGLASSAWPEEVFAILKCVDLKPGWYTRGAKQISQLIREYVADPSPSGLREIVAVLAAFGLSQKLQETRLSLVEKNALRAPAQGDKKGNRTA